MHPTLPSSKMLDKAGAADHLRLLPETFSALVQCGFFRPDADREYWSPGALDQTVENLLRDGLPVGDRLPYSHAVPRDLEVGGTRLHQGWRHGRASKLINQPFHSPAYIRQWFALERAYAAQLLQDSKKGNIGTCSNSDSAKLRAPPLVPNSPARIAANPTANRPAASIIRNANRGCASSSASREVNFYDTARGSIETPYGNEFLTDFDLYHRFRGKIAMETLANWRSARVGPPFIKIGKAPLYPLNLLIQWEARRLIVCDPVNVIGSEDESA